MGCCPGINEVGPQRSNNDASMMDYAEVSRPVVCTKCLLLVGYTVYPVYGNEHRMEGGGGGAIHNLVISSIVTNILL